MELALSAKRRLGYVTGKTAKPKEDEEKIEAWVVANKQVITWILQNRYTIANGARKFRLNKDSYEVTQNGRCVEEYYTQLQMIWDELGHMNTLPTISKVTTEMAEYLKTVESQAEERKLFQFLNGLDKEYGVLRSNILMMDPLLSVEHTVSIMLQEEMQTNNVGKGRQSESSALMSKGETEREKCIHCGRNNHRSDLCWEIKGYPVGHPRHKKSNFKPAFKSGNSGGYNQQRSYTSNTRQTNYKRSASNARTEQADLSNAIEAATQQLENLLKLVPRSGNVSKVGESEEELECNFAGMTNKTLQTNMSREWIVDSSATNHMTSQFDMLKNVKKLNRELKINLLDGRYVKVTHKGKVLIDRDLVLVDVLYVPEFKQNLLSVQKLARDNICYVTFFDTHCFVQGCTDGRIKGLGKASSGLYHFKPLKSHGVPVQQEGVKSESNTRSSRYTCSADCKSKANYEPSKKMRISCNQNSLMNTKVFDKSSLWHYRLGHAPLSKLKSLTTLDIHSHGNEICLTCPMAKLTKTPFPNSQTIAARPFDLIHIDIWGPYKVAYKGKFRYFLTVVDDRSRATWVYLLCHKSDSFDTIKNFYEYVKTQFERRIKIVRSDNAFEFDDQHCRVFFEENGIVHQTNIADTPQKNGIVERKHRHLLEVSRALRFHADLPL
ncbi:hypothetical protein RND81_02G100300 [Saponaria officinalis]|uniref:Integrase catalytic domain-containing protein n=1 Tax=Saponaria officinalis TaxID=3572 RepID=A0AAW1MSU3_SAPOF